MTTIAGDDGDDNPLRAEARLLRGSSSPSENWDDDFEFQAGAVPDAGDNAHDAMHAPTRPGQLFDQEESWDDAYEDDNTHSSPIKCTKKVVDEDVEDWDSSDNELENHDRPNRDTRNGQMHDFSFSGFEEEDKTVTARSTSSKPREPLPALPLPIPPSPSTQHFQAHTVLPPTTSPTLSTFSIPLSSTTRDRASIYSQDPLMPASNNSAPHLSAMRSYPHAAGSTPPRRGRRLRKKSRPPEADIFELEDRELDSVPASIPVMVNVPQLDISPPTTPPRAQQVTPESLSWPSQPSAPPTPSSSLLTRIGSFKRWARRSIGPDDPALSGWRRAKSSTGPSEAKTSHTPGELVTHGRKLSTGPEIRKSMENSVELDLRAVSPTPAPGGKARRSRGESASGLKSGWFFRAGGAVGSEKDDVTPTVQTLELTPSKRTTVLGLRRRNKEPTEDEDAGDEQGKTPTPRKAKAKLVPALKVGGSGGNHQQGDSKSPTRASKRPSSRDRPISLLHNGSRPMSILFPRNGSASMGRNAGLPVSASISGGSALLTSTGDSPEKDTKAHGESKDKDSGMRGLMNGVRRLSLVGAGHTHKRTKSTGGGDGAVEASRKDTVMRPRSQIDYYPSSTVEKSTPHTPIVRLGTHQYDEGNSLLPPVELEPPASGMFARRGSLPWADYGHSSAPESHAGVSFARFAHQPPNATDKPSRHRQSFSTSTSSLRMESLDEPLGSGRPTTPKHPPAGLGSVPVPVPTTLPDIALQSRPLTSTAPTERRSGLESRHAAPLQPHPQSQSPSPSTPQSASLGRSAASPSYSGGLRRNSLGDLKTPLNTLGEHKAQLPPLSELKIPARISRAQQGLRRDMGMVREFAGCVEQLKRLQAAYTVLLRSLRDAYETSLGSPASIAAQVQFHLPSRPPSRGGGKVITSNSNPSIQHIPTTTSLNSPTHLHPARSFSRASHEITRELVRLEHEYGIWWECAELLVELGGGSGVTASSASNPNLATQSTSTLSTPSEDLLKPRYPEEKHVTPRPITHVSSMSEPGSLFEQASSISSSKGPPQASPPHPSQWRASTGRHDLSARQLRLLKDMLNTPDPASLAYAAGPYGYGAGYPHPHSHPRSTAEMQPWVTWNPSALTLPSEESSADAHGQGAIAASEARREYKEKKRRVSRLGMLGLREILRGLKRNAVAEGRLSTGDEPVHVQQGSESGMGTPEDDHYNRRRSPWHQHDEHHVSKQCTGLEPNVTMGLPPSRNHPPKSPRRPSLASIFRLGNKNVRNGGANGKGRDTSLSGNGTTAEDGRASGLAADGMDEYADWERMSRSDLDLAATASGTATVRAKKAAKAPGSRSSINLNYPYSNSKAATPKKTPATSQTSLWDSSPSSATSPQSRLPVSIAEEGGDKHGQSTKTSGGTRSMERTSSWSQAHPPRPTSRNGKAAMSGTVRSAPPTDFSSPSPDPKLALTPENIKPLLEYAREVGIRLNECISEVQILLGASTKAS